MHAELLRGWSRAPSFSAAGVIMDAAGSQEAVGRRWLIVLSDTATHRATGARLTAGMMASFDEGEAFDLEVVEDLHFWHVELPIISQPTETRNK